MSKLIEIQGVYVREFWRSDPSAGIVVDVEGKDTSVFLECDRDELKVDQEYRFTGQWGKERKGYGKPFNASAFSLVIPHTRQSVIAYLSRAGEGLQFGRTSAAKCWDEWGQDAVKECRTRPEEVVRVAGRKLFTLANARALAEILRADEAMENCSLELGDLLNGRGFPRSTIREVIRKWGAGAAAKIRRNPFKLRTFRGCGFKRCDALWSELGLPADGMIRQVMAGLRAIAQNSDGHTWFPVQVPQAFIRNNIGGADPQPEKAVRLAKIAGVLSEVQTDGVTGPVVAGGAGCQAGAVRWVAERRKADNEKAIAEVVTEAMREGVKWP